MRHQLEFDLMNMSNEKRARKNALRKRVGTPFSPPTSTPTAQQPQALAAKNPSAVADNNDNGNTNNPGTAISTSSFLPAAELRRLAAGRTVSNEWSVADNAPPVLGAGQTATEAIRGKGKGKGGGGFRGNGVVDDNRPASGEAVEGVGVMRNHEWVMERVNLRKREESRKKSERFGNKRAAVWAPSMEQVTTTFS